MKKLIITLAALSGFFYSQNVKATCSNYTTYVDGQTLSAASLNSLQNNYTDCVNNVLNGDIFTGSMLWHSGYDILMYSDTGSTLKLSLDGASGDMTTEGQINLGTGGVILNDDGDGALTITGAGNGSDEDLTLNLDDTANHAVLSSSTGVTDLDLTGMDLLVGGSDVSLGSAGVKLTGDGDGSVTFLGMGDGSDEDLTINLDDTANTGVISSSTGLNNLSFSGIGISVSGDSTFDTSTLFVDSTNDRVGINTTTPADKLHIVSSSAAEEVMRITASGTSAALTTQIYNSDASERFLNRYDFSTDLYTLQSDSGVMFAMNRSGGVSVRTGTQLQLDSASVAGNDYITSPSNGVIQMFNNGTLGFSINNGAAIAGLTQAGQLTNCGMSVSGSTFTISGYDGTSLSSTNPCVIAVKSNTAGRVALARFTSDVTFTFGSSSDTDGNLFGITDANWSNTMPFFIGVIYDGSTPYFTISRVPHVVSGSASADLCQKGDTDCDAQADVMILSSGLTLSSFTSLPITQVGWFDMTYATSGGAWTSAITSKNGFNDNFETVKFTFPTGQKAAATGTFILNNGGTAPIFSENYYFYWINSSGMVTVSLYLDGDAGTDGSGAVVSYLATPYLVANTNIIISTNSFLYNYVATSGLGMFQLAGNDDRVLLYTNGTNALINSNFSNGSRHLAGSFTYPTLQ